MKKTQKDYTFYFKIISVTLFCLFILEVLVLNKNDLSFNGVYTERFFFVCWIITGFIGFKRFIFWFIGFIILTMIPMMMPFIMLIHWIFYFANPIVLENGVRVREVVRFGQEVPFELGLVKSKYFIFEETYKYIFSYECNIGDFKSIRSMKFDKNFNNENGIFINYEKRDTLKNCFILLDK